VKAQEVLPLLLLGRGLLLLLPGPLPHCQLLLLLVVRGVSGMRCCESEHSQLRQQRLNLLLLLHCLCHLHKQHTANTVK
jgi:hypothetical protein